MGNDDDLIVAQLEAVPEAFWIELLRARGAFDAEGEHVTWLEPSGGFAYVTYSEHLTTFVAALQAVAPVVYFDWAKWGGIARYPGGHGLEAAPVAEAVRLVTAIVRAERFNDNMIGASAQDGLLVSIDNRLRRWRNEERAAR
ncbi:MAG: hypothetical protein QOK20_2200 [Acidimicrobiaceae bacterium]|nr:hypothetical protein [Acidimicrobiaceae bacterium]